MITVIQYPGLIVPSGNEVLLKLQGNNQYISQGSRATFLLNWQSGQPIGDGQVLSLSWGAENITIFFRDSPSSDFEFSTTESIDETWVDAFNEFLFSFYAFNRDFYLHQSGLIVAKEIGSQYTITHITSIPGTSLNTNSNPGQDAVIRNAYQLIVQTCSADGNILGEDAIVPDQNGLAIFDVSEYLFNRLDLVHTHFTYPSNDRIIAHSSNVLAFYLRYSEYWDGQVNKLQTGTTCLALLAGLSRLKLHELALSSKSFYSLLSEKRFFLNTLPKEKTTCRLTPERLFYYCFKSATHHLKAKKFYVDGTDETVVLESKDLLSNQIYELDVSSGNFSQGNISLEKYEIWIEPDGEPENSSEIRTFFLDHTYHRHLKHFAYKNSLGGYDVIRCTGKMIRKPEIDREIFQDENKRRHSIFNLLDSIFSINTGSIDSEMASSLDDLFLSTKVFWITNNRLIEILITTKKKTKISGDQRRFNIEFEFSIANQEEFYSFLEVPEISLPNYNKSAVDA